MPEKKEKIVTKVTPEFYANSECSHCGSKNAWTPFGDLASITFPQKMTGMVVFLLLCENCGLLKIFDFKTVSDKLDLQECPPR